VQYGWDSKPFHGGQAFDDGAGLTALLAGGRYVPESQYGVSSVSRVGQTADAHRARGGQIAVQALGYAVDRTPFHGSALERLRKTSGHKQLAVRWGGDVSTVMILILKV
jgi:hypothetical protein